MKKKPHRKFAVPDPEKDKAALREHYKQAVSTDDDEEGIGTDALTKIGELADVLKGLKKKK
jgi:hypothetical protein